MIKIYMKQTLMFIAQSNPQLVENILQNSEPQETNKGEMYFVLKKEID